MGKRITVLLVLFCLTAPYLIIIRPSFADVAENSWETKAPMHEARSDFGVAVVNGKIYAIGGTNFQGMWPNEKGGIVGTNEEYNPANDTWVFKKPMPIPRVDFAVAVYQNKIYCIDGNTNQVYDPTTDSWENKTSMPTPKYLPFGNVFDDEIYLIGGYPNGTLNEVYIPATDIWTTKTPMPIAGGWPAGTFDNKFYFIGGYFDSDNSAKSVTQIYDPSTDTWSTGASPPTFFISGFAGVTTGVMALKRIYFFPNPYGAETAAPSDYAAKVYDPKTDSWTIGASPHTLRTYFGVAVVNDTVYVIGGSSLSYPTLQSYSTGGYVTKYATNEQYIPFGYGKPDPSYIPPDKDISHEIVQAQEPLQTMIIVVVSGVSTIVISASLLIYLKKRKH